MTALALPAPVAARLRRPTWRDPRLGVGVALVALAVALGSWTISSAARTVPVYVASGALTPGRPLAASAVRTVDVRLDAASRGRYLLATDPLPDDVVITRVVPEGELVPASALGEAADVDLRSVAVPVGQGLSTRIAAGATVDLWFVPADPIGSSEPAAAPSSLAAGVIVEQVDDATSGLVAGSTATLHVLVPTDALPAVLGALGDTGTVAVVPVAGS